MGYTVAGRKVLVTGASSGIGADLAVGFAKAGATVGICARRADRLADVLDACRTHAPDSRSWTIDLSDLDRVADFALQADDELGGIDVLVNNAGIPKRRPVTVLTIEEIDAVMAINYLSPVRLMMALLPRMLDRMSERGEARIVNISSVAAHLSPPAEAAYAASKAALTAWTESMALDLWDTGIKLHLVNPGVIDTELFHLPGNDPLIADVEALPVSEVTEAVLAQLDAGTFEIWVPPWFSDVAVGKAGDVGGFLAGSAAWLAQQRATS